MSVRNLFYEELKKYDINPANVKGWEVLLDSVEGPETLVVHLQNPNWPTDYDPQFVTKDPNIIRYAQISRKDIPLDSELSREQLLKRLFMTVRVYGGENREYLKLANMDYPQFMETLESRTSPEIATAIEMLETKYGINSHPETYLDYLNIRAYSELTRRFGSIPHSDFSEETGMWSTQDWADYYAHIYSEDASEDTVDPVIFWFTHKGPKLTT